MSLTYPVSEDTLLLKRNVLKLPLENADFLEVGTGSGEVALAAAEGGADVTAVDSDEEAVEAVGKRTSERGVEVEALQSDLLEEVDGSFDVIVFNPPYLPGKREGESDALVGGERGTELTESFIEQAKEHVRSEGEILFVASSLADLEQLEEKYEIEKLDEENMWFEKLFVYRLSA